MFQTQNLLLQVDGVTAHVALCQVAETLMYYSAGLACSLGLCIVGKTPKSLNMPVKILADVSEPVSKQ